MTGVPFGPSHPYRQTTEQARKAGKLGKAASPWRKFRLPGSPIEKPQRKV